MAEQLLCNLRQALHTHLENTRLSGPGQGPPVVGSVVIRQMTWQKHTAACKVAVRQWDARSRRTTAGRRHTRHHLKSNALSPQGLYLFPAAAKHIRTTPPLRRTILLSIRACASSKA